MPAHIFESSSSSQDFSYADIYSPSMISILEGHENWSNDRSRRNEELRTAVKERLCEGVPVEDFVHHVWRLPLDKMQVIMEQDWPVCQNHLDRYRATLEGRGNQSTSFRVICSRLLNDVHEAFGMRTREMEDEFLDSRGRPCLENAYVDGDPDFVRVWKSDRQDALPDWESVKTFINFTAVDSTRRQQVGESLEEPEHIFGPPHYVTLAHPFDQPGAFQTMSTTNDITDDELRIALYAKECFTVYADRSYVTALLIDGFKGSLWYFDHHLAMHTVSFDFSSRLGLRYLALVLFAMAKCDMQGAGFNPLFQRLHGLSSGDRVAWTPIDNPAKVADDNCYVFPLRKGEKQRRFFVIDDWVDATYRFIAPGTTTHSVRTGVLGGKVSYDSQTLKMTWRPQDEDHEQITLGHIMAPLPDEWLAHVPLEITFAAAYSVEDLQFPWTKMDIRLPPELEDVDPPSLHVSVYPECQPLWEAGSVKDFKRVFIHCLECHYHAYKDAEHLHGAIGERSLKVKNCTNADGRRRRPLGILTDWEIGPQPRQEDDTEHPMEVGHGSGPFTFIAAELALDIQVFGTARMHYYRHDLESFFYVLVWACVHYNLNDKHRDAVDPHGVLREWSSKESSPRSKMEFINSRYGYGDKVSDLVKSECDELYETWVRPLRRLFRTAFASIPGEGDDDEDYDFETCNGLLTFENFMQVIGQTPRRLEPR
ncbi:unnamed protein product [Cyclocybe aegerita]|uniref:Fungal-type protein kinase domain-containing protein n=1 Tax=Cyclocybe aegerita TaxID=1973307 RepID=A0A8S0WRC2_CYCAE|nr:unnamed protein product [Cyclocybe aegerita]